MKATIPTPTLFPSVQARSQWPEKMQREFQAVHAQRLADEAKEFRARQTKTATVPARGK